MKLLQYPQLGEKVYWEKLPNGLTIAVVPREGFTKKLAYFMTDFGSIHTNFELEGETYTVPAGIAHYLEHKLFDMPGGQDISAEFAQLGANVNAFTSYDVTAYHFSCTNNFEACLKLLLEFVSTPYFTEESVEKERGIIDQEIGMNADNPDSVIMERLMQQMYYRHKVGEPILGTSQSIREITPELLYLCHRAFYVPGNMLLCVVGDVEPEQVTKIAQECLPKECLSVAKKRNPLETELDCPVPFAEGKMDVAMPTFQLGFKCADIGKGEESFRKELIGDMAAEQLFGESSALYQRLYEEGLIDTSFGGGFESLDGCAMLMCGGDSENPEAVRDALIAQAQHLAQEGIPEEDFRRMKRSIMGRRVRGLDSFDSTCFRICAGYFSQVDYLRYPEIYADLRREDVQAFLKEVVRLERSSLSVLYPLQEKE